MSEIRATTISDAAGTGPITLTGQYAAKAWVNFNGEGTISIRESGNVSSLTDGGTGQYTVTFTNSLSSSDYASIVGGARHDYQTGIDGYKKTHSQSTASVQVGVMGTSTSYADHDLINVSVTQ